MCNVDVRQAIKIYGFRNYEVAAALGISEYHFSHKLTRAELTEGEKRRVMDAVKMLDADRKADIESYMNGGIETV